MPRRMCRRHRGQQPCTCAMGNLSRFIEPVVLLLLQKKGASYGYDLAQELPAHALTDAEVERGALYRTLRQLEANGHVTSEWEIDDSGPARRIYRLTAEGRKHLEEWTEVLAHVADAMGRFVRDARTELSRQGGREARNSQRTFH